MNKIYALLMLMPLFFSCGKKERVLKTTSIEISLDHVFINLTPVKESSHLSVFNNHNELKTSFNGLIVSDFTDRSLAVLDSNTDYTLEVNSIELNEKKWPQTSKSCLGYQERYQLESVTLKITILLHDNVGTKVGTWSQICLESDRLESRTISVDKNETCQPPCVKEIGSFNEYNKLQKEIHSLCKKVTNKIVKIEK
jgi:hypothetical protein